ncbi:MAG: hypothetical protein RH949_03405 [Coleofasciculus sp. A1-SPW-01]|uniref:hypothetical protein n=1 Tax=Coleofasciculus sp. A1-SPW-01 TaxID=3070819 RepID=UPI0032F9A00A
MARLGYCRDAPWRVSTSREQSQTIPPFPQANGEAVLALADAANSAPITPLPQTETTQAGETSTPQ